VVIIEQCFQLEECAECWADVSKIAIALEQIYLVADHCLFILIIQVSSYCSVQLSTRLGKFLNRFSLIVNAFSPIINRLGGKRSSSQNFVAWHHQPRSRLLSKVASSATILRLCFIWGC
jgi:hypothetical protein